MRRLLKGLLFGLAFGLAGITGAQAAASCGDNTGQAASGEPIVIGAITGKTGPDDFSNATKAAKAYFDCLNANGGIKGRPVSYLVEDDQWNPEIAAQLAAKLVDDKKAVLMVGNSSYVECGANAEFYKKAGIYVVAGVGVPRECFFADNIAPTNAGPRVSMLGAMGYALDKLNAKSVVCIAPNIPNVGTWSCDGVMLLAKEKGFAAQTILMDPGSADATSVILQAASSKPDVIVLGLSKGVAVPLMTAAEEQGLNQTITFLSAASAYDLSARIAEKALMTLDPAKINRETASAAVRGIKDFKSDIFCAPWYFGDGQSRHNANSTTRMAVAEGGKWKVVSDCTPSPDPELKDVRAFEKSAGIN